MNNDNERVTVVLPKTHRERAKGLWNLKGSKFSYSQFIRQVMTVYFEDKDDNVS